MNIDFLNLLKADFQDLKNKFQKAKLEGRGTPQEISDRNEAAFRTILRKYFPFPFKIVKGNISDSLGERSCSIDCIVLDPTHPYTIDVTSQKPSVVFADGVDYAVEIKDSLKSDDEIERALNQIISVKRLHRVKGGILGIANEFHHKIPCVIYANSSYQNIDKLIETIINFYEKNKIKRISQFDMILTSDYLIINKCKGIFVRDDVLGFSFANSGDLGLAYLLYFLNIVPRVEPDIDQNMISIYLKGIIDNKFSRKEIWDKRLQNIK